MTQMISGRHARELLDPIAEQDAVFATPPWDEYVTVGAGRSRMSVLDVRDDVVADVYEPDALPLIAAAPDLASTVAWLYGREIDDHLRGSHLTPGGAVSAEPCAVVADIGTFTPDDAVDLARALLAAAEEARRG